MNALLASGEVPGLYEGKELTALMAGCRESAQRDGVLVDSEDELFRRFTTKARIPLALYCLRWISWLRGVESFCYCQCLCADFTKTPIRQAATTEFDGYLHLECGAIVRSMRSSSRSGLLLFGAGDWAAVSMGFSY